MNEDNYTSPELSKWLSDNGCEIKSEYNWQGNCVSKKWYLRTKKQVELSIYPFEKHYPAYDIMNDICVKYCLDFFGIPNEYYRESEDVHEITEDILFFLQEGKKEEAEDRIQSHFIIPTKLPI